MKIILTKKTDKELPEHIQKLLKKEKGVVKEFSIDDGIKYLQNMIDNLDKK